MLVFIVENCADVIVLDVILHVTDELIAGVQDDCLGLVIVICDDDFG